MSAAYRTPARADLSVVNAAIERFLQRAGELANFHMSVANAFGDQHSALRRIFNKDPMCNQLEANARQRAGDVLDRAIAHAKRIRAADAQRRFSTTHFRHRSAA